MFDRRRLLDEEAEDPQCGRRIAAGIAFLVAVQSMRRPWSDTAVTESEEAKVELCGEAVEVDYATACDEPDVDELRNCRRVKSLYICHNYTCETVVEPNLSSNSASI